VSPGAPEDRANIGRGVEPARAVLITCEHASPLLPAGMDVGVSADVRTSHVGWDAGAAEIAAVVAGELGSACVSGAYSRLWVDLNRPAHSAAAVPAMAFGVAIPGNQGLADELRAARLAQFHAPHWQGIIGAIEKRVDLCGGCLHVAVHSFDPALDPGARRFDVGVLFDPGRQPEAEVAAWLGDALGRAGHDTRANQPYLGTDEGMTTWLRERFPAPVYTGIEIEASQALATDPDRARKLALSLARALRQCARRWPG
jgi:predicted N-formylglutamate amidohydrolase